MLESVISCNLIAMKIDSIKIYVCVSLHTHTHTIYICESDTWQMLCFYLLVWYMYMYLYTCSCIYAYNIYDAYVTYMYVHVCVYMIFPYIYPLSCKESPMYDICMHIYVYMWYVCAIYHIYDMCMQYMHIIY